MNSVMGKTSETRPMDVDPPACPAPVGRRRFISGVVEGFYGNPWSTAQRRRLFERLGRWDMNSYMYAPKDDVKHRQRWREPFTSAELDNIASLINACRLEGVDFIFAISPGLDMVYSSETEFAFLKQKLDQVACVGCKSFAVLFDDIELRLSDVDSMMFASFAHAHVFVANAVYEHLGRPETFLFCPTEYCGSRAIPTVSESLYLHTVGAQLNVNIGVLWTGPLVIPRTISVQSIQEVGKVLRRRPVIWDNLHANDYDRQRLFLGPYQGRPLTLRRYIRGVLANPNCECEANFIPLHTLSTWCSTPVPPAEPPPPIQEACSAAELSSSCSSRTSVLSETRTSDDEFYDARQALDLALGEWMVEVRKPCSDQPAELSTSYDSGVLSPLGACAYGSSADSAISSLVGSACYDCAAAPLPAKVLSDEQLSLLVDMFHLPHEHGSSAAGIVRQFSWLCRSCGWSAVDQATITSPSDAAPFGLEEDEAMVDCTSLLEARSSDSDLLMSSPSDTDMQLVPSPAQSASGTWSPACCVEWQKQANEFHATCRKVQIMANQVLEIPNYPLLSNLHSCVVELLSAISRVDSFVSRLESLTTQDQSRLLSWWLEPSLNSLSSAPPLNLACQWNDTQEPWCVRGGLTGDLLRLLPDLSVLDAPPCAPSAEEVDSGLSDVPSSPGIGVGVGGSILQSDCSDLLFQLLS